MSYDEKINVRLAEETKAALLAAAARAQRKPADLVRVIVTEYLQSNAHRYDMPSERSAPSVMHDAPIKPPTGTSTKRKHD